MRGFPAAPGCADPRFKLKALVPSAPTSPSLDLLAQGMVNLGNSGNMAVSCTRSVIEDLYFLCFCFYFFILCNWLFLAINFNNIDCWKWDRKQFIKWKCRTITISYWGKYSGDRVWPICAECRSFLSPWFSEWLIILLWQWACMDASWPAHSCGRKHP